MASVQRIGRRTWLSRMAGGFVGVWAGLNAEHGRDTWGAWLTRDPRVAAAQSSRAETIPVEITVEFGGSASGR